MSRYPYAYGWEEAEAGSAGLLAKTLLMMVVLFGVAALGAFSAPLFPPTLWAPLAIGQLVLIFVMSFFLQRSLFWAETFSLLFAFLNGLTLAPLLAMVLSTNPAALANALVATAVSFAAAAAIVAVSRINFGSLLPFLFVSLLALVVAGILALFLPSLLGITASPLYNLFGVVVFLGFTLVDFWRIKNRAYILGDENIAAVFLSVSLYLDFVNLFLFFLRFFGWQGSSRRS